MKASPEKISQKIMAEMRKIGIDIPLEVTEMPADRYSIYGNRILLHLEGVPYPLMYEMPVERDNMPESVAWSVAQAIARHQAQRPQIEKQHREILEAMMPLVNALPEKPVLVMDSESQMENRFEILLRNLSHGLLRQWTRHRHVGTRNIGKLVQELSLTELDLQKRITDAGGRLEALSCCPVAARAIRLHPEQWGRLRDDLNGSGEARSFKNGSYQPEIRLGNSSIRWRGGTLKVRSSLPDTVVSSFPGRRLVDVVEHPLLSKAILITHVNKRHSDDHMYIRTDASPEPIKPLLKALRIET